MGLRRRVEGVGLRRRVEGVGLRRRGGRGGAEEFPATSRQKGRCQQCFSTTHHIIPSPSSSVPSCLIFLGVGNGYRMLRRRVEGVGLSRRGGRGGTEEEVEGVGLRRRVEGVGLRRRVEGVGLRRRVEGVG